MGNVGKIMVISALLCMAFFISKPVVIKSGVYKAFRSMSRIQMMYQTRGWQEKQSTHFILRYQSQDNNVAGMVLSSAENNYPPVNNEFGGAPREKILIVLYPSKEYLSRSFGWAADESAMGVYWAGVIRVLSPQVWIQEENPEKTKLVFETEGPMAHELTHLLIDYATGGNYTRWFTEGVAQYTEAKLTGFQTEPEEIKNLDGVYSLTHMDRDFDSLEDQGLAYYESFQAVKYLAGRYGEESLKGIINSLGRGNTIEASFNDVLGIDLNRFDREFKQWLLNSHAGIID